jgi:hypothetical protein
MGDGLLAVVIAVIIESMLIQRLKKLRMEVIVSIQAIEVLPWICAHQEHPCSF